MLKRTIDEVTTEDERPSKKQKIESNIVTLNVGGTLFTTSKTTLLSNKDSFFTQLLDSNFTIDKDEQGHIFIDRDPKHFPTILNYLRDGRQVLTAIPNDVKLRHQIAIEAKFYNLKEFATLLLIEVARVKFLRASKTEENEYYARVQCGLEYFAYNFTALKNFTTIAFRVEKRRFNSTVPKPGKSLPKEQCHQAYINVIKQIIVTHFPLYFFFLCFLRLLSSSESTLSVGVYVGCLAGFFLCCFLSVFLLVVP